MSHQGANNEKKTAIFGYIRINRTIQENRAWQLANSSRKMPGKQHHTPFAPCSSPITAELLEQLCTSAVESRKTENCSVYKCSVYLRVYARTMSGFLQSEPIPLRLLCLVVYGLYIWLLYRKLTDYKPLDK